VRGELLGAEGDLREAVRVLSGSAMRVEHARALLALGRRLRLERQPTEAREPLREALAVASRCGADGLAAEARAELGAAGARPRTDALAGPEALTPSERRIAVMAAGGRTNRDIAQELFVTPKTVEVHLSAAYRKLGIASRRGLPQALEV
jgi:DNA-binding NarL/FixJ family response regulator